MHTAAYGFIFQVHISVTLDCRIAELLVRCVVLPGETFSKNCFLQSLRLFAVISYSLATCATV